MKRYLACVVIAAVGLLIIGCDGMTGTTQDKIQTTTTQTKDGKVVGETTTTNETKSTPAGSGMTTEKTSEKTSETTK